MNGLGLLKASSPVQLHWIASSVESEDQWVESTEGGDHGTRPGSISDPVIGLCRTTLDRGWRGGGWRVARRRT